MSIDRENANAENAGGRGAENINASAAPPRVAIEAFTPYEIPGKPWGTELVVAETKQYLGKCLTMRAGHRGGLQYHERKDETFYLVRGRAWVRSENERGALKTQMMQPGQAFHVAPGAVHQVEAIDECVFFETSTPVFGDRVNVADAFNAHELGQAW